MLFQRVKSDACLNLVLMWALNHATTKHQTKPLKLKINPKNKIDRLTLGASGTINWGTKVIKNKVTVNFENSGKQVLDMEVISLEKVKNE